MVGHGWPTGTAGGHHTARHGAACTAASPADHSMPQRTCARRVVVLHVSEAPLALCLLLELRLTGARQLGGLPRTRAGGRAGRVGMGRHGQERQLWFRRHHTDAARRTRRRTHCIPAQRHKLHPCSGMQPRFARAASPHLGPWRPRPLLLPPHELLHELRAVAALLGRRAAEQGAGGGRGVESVARRCGEQGCGAHWTAPARTSCLPAKRRPGL